MRNLPRPIARVMEQITRWDPVPSRTERATRATKTGVVYFVLSGSRHLKIGWTTCIKGRLKELQTGSPQSLSLLTTLPNQTQQDERDLHKRFRRLRRQGEWFMLKDELLEYVSEIMGWPHPPRKQGGPRAPSYFARIDRMKASLEFLKGIVEGTRPPGAP